MSNIKSISKSINDLHQQLLDKWGEAMTKQTKYSMGEWLLKDSDIEFNPLDDDLEEFLHEYGLMEELTLITFMSSRGKEVSCYVYAVEDHFIHAFAEDTYEDKMFRFGDTMGIENKLFLLKEVEFHTNVEPQDVVAFNGKEFPVREVADDNQRVYRVSVESLAEQYTNGSKYEAIDEGIAFYVPDDKITCSDMEMLEILKKHDVIDKSEIQEVFSYSLGQDIYVKCPECGNSESQPIDQQRSHLQTFNVVSWVKENQSLCECDVCKKQFLLNWHIDQSTPILEDGNFTSEFQIQAHDIIMTIASDIAESLVEAEVGKENTWIEDQPNEFIFTDEAQEIYNVHYDELTETLYRMANQILALQSNNQ